MKKKQKPGRKDQSSRKTTLQVGLKETQKALGNEKPKSRAYEIMIEVAENESP